MSDAQNMDESCLRDLPSVVPGIECSYSCVYTSGRRSEPDLFKITSDLEYPFIENT